MAVLTVEQVRDLASIRSDDAAITSCYLDIDGRRHLKHQDYESELDTLLRRARSRVNGNAQVRADLDRIEQFVKGGLDRSSTRGLAIFACQSTELWKVIELPVPVRSQIVVNRAPAVSQLEALLEQSGRLAILLADRQRTRLFVFQLGDLIEHVEDLDELPRDYDSRGERERGDVSSHVSELNHQHLRHAAAVAWELHQREPFDQLAIGGPDPVATELEHHLHSYLQARLCGRVNLTAAASLDEVRTVALELERDLERSREAEAVALLREAVAAGGKAVAGLDAVLDALAARRVHQLLVSDGFEAPGWHCAPCDRLARVGRSCPSCNQTMDPVADVVEDAVEDALANGCRVEMCIDNADLDVLGRIGATLRY